MWWKRNILMAYVRVGEVVVARAEDSIEVLKTYTWNGSLDDVFVDIASEFGDSVRIILDDELVYVVGWTVNQDSTSLLVDKEYVLQYASTILPEDVEELVWDWKWSSEGKEEVSVGVAGVGSFFTEQLVKAVRNANVEIALGVPVSSLLAEELRAYDSGVLVVYGMGERVLLVMAQRGVVHLSVVCGKSDWERRLTDLAGWAQNELGVAATEVVCGGDITSTEVTLEGVSKVDKVLDPWGAMAKRDEKHNDSVIHLDFRGVYLQESKPVRKEKTKEDRKGWKMFGK